MDRHWSASSEIVVLFVEYSNVVRYEYDNCGMASLSNNDSGIHLTSTADYNNPSQFTFCGSIPSYAFDDPQGTILSPVIIPSTVQPSDVTVGNHAVEQQQQFNIFVEYTNQSSPSAKLQDNIQPNVGEKNVEESKKGNTQKGSKKGVKYTVFD